MEYSITYTVDYIYNLPEGERAELIDGKVYYMAPPGRKHQRITLEISTAINNYIKSNHGHCEVNIAPFAVFLNDDDKNYVEPDISVVCDTKKLNDKGCMGSPDWIIEVVSPGSRHMDYTTKLFKYRTAGIREYWIVDAYEGRVMTYLFYEDEMKEYSFIEDIPVTIFSGLFINLSKLGILG